MANCYDVVGYVIDECTLICAECLEDDEPDDSPVFGDSETDSPSHCERCGELIEESLTTEGMYYVQEAVWDGDGDREVLALWASKFDYAFPQCSECGERLNEVGQRPASIVTGERQEYWHDEGTECFADANDVGTSRTCAKCGRTKMTQVPPQLVDGRWYCHMCWYVIQVGEGVADATTR